ncbi:pyridoxamine 5'-phosphate oxidase family protein [Tateyamaria sp. SN6-1]|uniref:FAD-binding oxidoreductase n=1 Tax=Tateyamaria sp. SN6-1 TaxID=3092148 RepID=UPI0039F4A67D
MLDQSNPFHAGEIKAQERAGVTDLAQRVGGFIRDHMPDQHRDFFASLPFLVMAAGDGSGRPWVTIVEGRDGFISSPDPRRLRLDAAMDPHDPLADMFAQGTQVGMVGIELATRRRNRMNGRIQPTSTGFDVTVGQSFGNCPQYINERAWHRVEAAPEAPRSATALSDDQMAMIRAADTLFVGTGRQGGSGTPSDGFDASHRGGAPGFVHVVNRTHLRLPDYAGNNFFNTIGNLLENPSIGLLFVDFETGGLLHISGRADIDWEPSGTAQRHVEVSIDRVIERPAALGLRWDVKGDAVRQLVLARKVEEADAITSFYFEPVDGRPLPPFKAGQHLPIELRLAPPQGLVKRTYSLSAASNGASYRLSIKREDRGLVSRVMHDALHPGDVIEARAPSGDFVLPDGRDPVVLVSAGVGITPVMAMLEQISGETEPRPTWFIHGARNGATHAMGAAVRDIAQGSIQARFYYSQPRQEDQLGRDYDVAGRVSARALLDLNAGPNAHYLLCGPAAFVSDVTSGLEAAGIALGHIQFETF